MHPRRTRMDIAGLHIAEREGVPEMESSGKLFFNHSFFMHA